MGFQTFLEAAEYVLDRESRELPNEDIVRMVVNEGLFKTKSSDWFDQYNSLQGTLNKVITQTQYGKPESEWRFYRTPKKPHAASGRPVHHFGLAKWLKRSPDSKASLTLVTEERPSPPTPVIPVPLDRDIEEWANLLVQTGRNKSTAEALQWLAREGVTARHAWLEQLGQEWDRFRRFRDEA